MTAATNREPAARRETVALMVCMLLITATVGFLQPFVSLYLEAAGLTKTQIGVVLGVGSGMALWVQPLLGRLSDRLDARRPLMIGAALIAGGAYLSYREADSLFAFLALTTLGVNGFTYLNAVGGVLIGRMVPSAAQGGAAYARFRVWGSVGYIVVTLLTGWLVSRGLGPRAGLGRAELDPAFTYGPLLFFVIALVAPWVPDRKMVSVSALTPFPFPNSVGPSPTSGRGVPATPTVLAPRAAEVASATGTPLPEVGEGPTELGKGKGVRAGELHTRLQPFLLAYFLYQFALYGASAYLSLYMKALGAAPLWISAMFAAGVVSEVLVMVRVGRFTDVYGRRPALAVAFVLMPLRLLLYIPATGPLWVLLVQTLHGLNFGIMGAIAVVFVNDLANDANRGALQARLFGVQGLALALGPVACGVIAQQRGTGWMFAAMAFVGTAGAVVFFARVRESHPFPLPLQKGPALLRLLGRVLSEPPTRDG